MDSDASRAVVLGTLRLAWDMSPDLIASLADGSQHAPAILSETESLALLREFPGDAPAWVRADLPEWLLPSLALVFRDRVTEEGQALAKRAPVDLRVNTLKTTRDKVVTALARHGAKPTRLSPVGVRIEPPALGGRTPNVEAEPSHARGHFEVQDEGSQIAALLAGAGKGMQVADVCAGAGGKTLALAAQMSNTGQIYAYDADASRLRPIVERLQRAGVRNAQVLPPGATSQLEQLHGRMDLVLVDAPCTGSGVWRRRPDAKWRLKPDQLAARLEEQRAVLALAAPLVKPGGQLVYVTCSLLPEENGDQVAAFLEHAPEFSPVSYRDAWTVTIATEPPVSADRTEARHLLLTPAQHETDGFFVATLQRRVS
jgi:16S rRNA (cytosine967-C5)-methyltransferase